MIKRADNLNRHFFSEHTDAQWAQEKMLNAISLQGNAKRNEKEMPLHTH